MASQTCVIHVVRQVRVIAINNVIVGRQCMACQICAIVGRQCMACQICVIVGRLYMACQICVIVGRQCMASQICVIHMVRPIKVMTMKCVKFGSTVQFT